MHRPFVLASIVLLAATPAFAAGATCSTAPVSKFQPKATLEKQLKAEGMTIRQIKTEKGCYEVYALDKGGKAFNAAYNAETLQKTANAEAGES